MRKIILKIIVITSSVEKIFIIIINKNGSVKPLIRVPKLSKKYFPRYSVDKNYPHLNVDFVDNLLISIFPFYLSTIVDLNVDKSG